MLTAATNDDFDADWENERQLALREGSALVGAIEEGPVAHDALAAELVNVTS
jgi:hypothetical protein